MDSFYVQTPEQLKSIAKCINEDAVNQTFFKGAGTYYLWESSNLGGAVIYSVTAEERLKSLEKSLKSIQCEINIVKQTVKRNEEISTIITRSDKC